MNLKKTIRTVPDFPKKGVMFRDITTLLKDPKALKNSINKMAKPYKNLGITKVVGAESRGFIFGTGIALKLGAGFVPVRKPGKLPAKTLKESYELEYGTDTLEMHEDAIQKGEKVLVVDDLLATGGTIKAVCKMVETLGGEVVGISFLIDLKFLHKDIGYKYSAVIEYDSE